jgi:hypothetical protein
VSDFIIPRLTEVVTGKDRAGISVATTATNEGLPNGVSADS